MNQQQENKLEALIPKAAAEPAYRPEFFRVLLESEVYVIGDYGQADEGHGYLTDGDSLSILAMPLDENTQIIPFFFIGSCPTGRQYCHGHTAGEPSGSVFH